MQIGQSWHSKSIGKPEEQSFLWLHGWGHDHTALTKIATLFETCGSHTLYDLPGFGETPMLTPRDEDHPRVSTRAYARSLAAQLPKTGKHILVGHSYGTRVIVQFASLYPERVKAIILISAAGLKRKRSMAFKIKAFLLRQLGSLCRTSDSILRTKFYGAFASRFGSKDYKNAGAMRPVLISAVNENLSMVAKSLTCPTLLIYGSEDTETPPEIGHKYSNFIPISRYEELKGFDHFDILTRGSYQCQALIKKFLKDLEA